MFQESSNVHNNYNYNINIQYLYSALYIYIFIRAHTSYKVVHRKCNCIQTEYKKIIILLKYMNKMNSVMIEN